MLRTRHYNTGVSTNISISTHDILPFDGSGEQLEIQFPVSVLKSVDNSNAPLHSVDDYIANQKSMVNELLYRKNLNENLNFKNSFYASDKNDPADGQALTIFGYRSAFQQETDDANARAGFNSEQNIKRIGDREKRVKDFLRKTEEVVEERKSRQNEQVFVEAEKQVLLYAVKCSSKVRKKTSKEHIFK